MGQVCSSGDELAISISSMQTKTKSKPQITQSMNCWNVWEAVFSPNGMKRNQRGQMGL